MKIVHNTQGAITPLALIVAFYLTATLLCLLFLLHEWHVKVDIQYRLDHCMAETSQTLVERFQAFEDGNLRMQWARMIAKATQPFPPISAIASAWNTGEFAFQMFRYGKHFTDQGNWSRNGGCHGEGSGYFILPSNPYSPNGSDDLGPLPFKFEDQGEITFSLTRSTRSSTVTLYTSPSMTAAGALDRVIPRELKEILNNPIVASACKSSGMIPLPTKKWRSAWVPKF